MANAVWDWSTTAASNNSATPFGWPEGQNASTVNDCGRQMMATIKEAVTSTVASGTADALTITLANVPAALTDGMEILVRAAAANATTTPTLNLNSLGAKTITKVGGTALVPGDIAGNLHELLLRYNLANTRWELLNPATIDNTKVQGLGTAATLNVGTAANNIPQLNGSAKLPAVDGSQLTNLPGIPGFVNMLRGNSLSSWENGTTGTITTAGGWAASGVYVIPTGASVVFAQLTGQQPGYYALQLQGATGVTGLKARFVVESNQGATLAQYLRATFQITAYQSSGGSVTPTITVKHAGAQDNWASPVADVSAQNMTALANAAQQVTAYTFNVSGGMANGVEVEVDFGNNWGASGKNIVIYAGFDLRATPGVATGINTSPPTPEIRDPQSDIAWCQRFFYSTYENGTAPGTSTHNGMVFVSVDATRLDGGLTFPVPMIAAPTTVNEYDGAGTANKFSYLSASAYTDGYGTFSLFDKSKNGVHFQSTTASGGVYVHLTADARIVGG